MGFSYGSPWARLIETASITDDCWIGINGEVCRGGYVRLCFYIIGLQARPRLSAHIATWLCMELAPDDPWTVTADELYLAYLEVRESELELDHKCGTPACRNPKHLEALTPEAHRALTLARRRPAAEDDDEEIPF